MEDFSDPPKACDKRFPQLDSLDGTDIQKSGQLIWDSVVRSKSRFSYWDDRRPWKGLGFAPAMHMLFLLNLFSRSLGISYIFHLRHLRLYWCGGVFQRRDPISDLPYSASQGLKILA